MAWFENKIYVTYHGIKRVRVFADHAPFNELPEGIEIKKIELPVWYGGECIHSFFIR